MFAITRKENVQLLFARIDPPVCRIPLSPNVKVPPAKSASVPPQLLLTVLLKIVMPTGKVSVTEVMFSVVLLGLVTRILT